MPQFSRITIIEAIGLLESLTHADLDRFLLKYGLERIAHQELRPKTAKLNAVIKYLIDNPDEKGPFGANLTFEIIEDELINISPNIYAPLVKKHFPKLLNSLKRDGYVITDGGGLKRMLPENNKFAEEENELNSLLDKFGFITTKGHFDLAISAHTKGHWASANAQLRSFMESLFNSITDKLVSTKITTLQSLRFQKSCEILAKLKPPFLMPTLNECGFLKGLWKRLHPQGSHPGLSNEEDSTFRLHLLILTASYYLKRLDGRKGNP